MALALTGIGCRHRYLLGIGIGALSSAILDTPLPGAVAIALGATASAWLGAHCRRIVLTSADWLGRQREAAAYLAASLLAPLGAVLIGGGGLIALSMLSWRNAPFILFTWWCGDAIGILAVAPAFAVICSWGASPPRITRDKFIKAVILALTIVSGLSWLLYEINGAGLVFSLLLLLFVAHALLGTTAVKITSFVVISACAVALKQGALKFAPGDFSQNIALLEIFFGLYATSALLIASLERRQLIAWPTIILLAGWIMSSWVFTTFDSKQRAFDEYRLTGLIEQRQNALAQRMRTYADALRGGASLLSASGSISSSQWRAYTEALRLFDLYPGVHGVGVVYPLRKNELPSFLSEMKRERPDYNYHRLNAGQQPVHDEAGYEYFVIGMVEPVKPNAAAIGLDLASEPIRQDAAIQARDMGKPHATRSIQLVQDNISRPGFLLYLPVFESGRPTNTVQERRAAFKCWVYAPFVFEEFVEGVLGRNKDKLDYNIFENFGLAGEILLYPNAQELVPRQGLNFDRVTQVKIAEQNYTIGWVQNVSEQDFEHLPAMLAASSLALASALLAGLIFSLQSFAHRAGELVSLRTHELEMANQKLEFSNQSLVETGRQLREREAESRKLALIAAHTTNAVMVTDADGFIEWVNEGFFRMTGFSIAEAKGQKPGSLLQGPETDPDTVRLFRDELKLKHGFSIEILNYTKQGAPFWSSIEVQPVFEDGRLVNYMGIQTNITEQKSSRKELEESRRRAESANDAKSAFLGNISHELRTPLNVIIGSVNLLLQGRYGPMAGAQKKALEQTRENSYHLLSLINDLLDLTKAESGKLSLELRPVNISALCDETLEMFSHAAAQKNLTLDKTYSQFTQIIEADPLRLRQILFNLLGNAVKFTPSGGRISLLVQETADPRELTLTVIDTGVGVRDVDQERVFQDFEQANNGLTSESGGTGLGLPIARRLAQLHGGRLTLRSEPGKGSCFVLSLPIREAAQREDLPLGLSPAEAKPAPRGQPEDTLILVVEDYPANLELLCSYLELEGYKVIQATNGAEAIAKAIEAQPQLILMDVKMPGIDGLEATRQIKADPRTKDIPVITLTAFARASDAADSLKSGAVEYLSKPVDFAKLDTAIAKHAGLAKA